VSALTNKLTVGAMNDRMIATLRSVLALSSFLMIFLDSSEPKRSISITYVTLGFYLLYSVVLLVLTIRQQAPLPATSATWSDLGWYVVLIGLSGGISLNYS
jgi:hypothetical protein